MVDVSNEDATVIKYKTTVLYGDTGKRKTTTACSMIKERGMLIASDNSWSVLDKPRHKDLKDKTTVILYEDLRQLKELKIEGYDTVILDTLDAMVDDYIDLLMEHSKWPKGYREKLISNHPALQNITSRAQQDYGVARDKFRPVINQLIKAPFHVIFNCHMNNPTVGLNASLVHRPRLPEATWFLINRPADIIGHLSGRDNKFIINMNESSSVYACKSRVEGISGEMDLDKFVKAYHERT